MSRLGLPPTTGRPVDQTTVRDLNRSLVLDAIRRSGPASRADLARSTKLTKPTVSAIVDQLIESGLVVERGDAAVGSAGGRPARLLEFNGRSEFFAGVEIRERVTRVALVEASGKEVASDAAETVTDIATMVKTIESMVRSCLGIVSAPLARLGGVGVVVPGLVDEASGTCLLAPNVGWRDENIGALIAAQLPAPVAVRNHALASALAEAREGAGRDARVMVMLQAGLGVGAGVTVDGQLYAGASGVAAEIGHCPVPGASGRCTCGHRGCLETVASVRGIVRASGVRGGVRRDAERSLRDVAAAAATGDGEAQRALWNAAAELGLAGATLVNLFGPDVVVVAGSVFDVDGVLTAFRRSLAEHSLTPLVSRLVVRQTELGEAAGMRGALLTAMAAPTARSVAS